MSESTTPVPAEAALSRDDRDIIKAQILHRTHGRSVSTMSVASADMALERADDVIDIVLAAAVPVLLAAERERIATAIEAECFHDPQPEKYDVCEACAGTARIARTPGGPNATV